MYEEEQRELLVKAKESLNAARIMHKEGFYGFAASRAYYSMFYLAEAILLSEELSFSKHSAVHSAFAKRYVKTGKIPAKFHRYLIRGMEARHTGDYETTELDADESIVQIERAEEFYKFTERLISA